MGFFTPPRIVWGPGAIEQLSALGAHRAFLVVDPRLGRLERHRRVAEEFAKSDTTIEVFRDFTVPPTVQSVTHAAEELRRFGPDWIIALGGGSTIDTGKALWGLYEQPGLAFASMNPLVELTLRRKARFAAIPTTSGSGSESSWVAHLWGEDGAPIELASRELVPDWALLDPGFPVSLPLTETLDSAWETLGQALEALASAWSNPFSDAHAREAIQTVFYSLPKTIRQLDDREARAPLHYAATAAGLAASNAQLGVGHALARALVGPTGLSYGRLLGIVLPAVTEFNYPGARERYASLTDPPGANPTNNRSTLAERLRSLADQVRFPKSLAAAGVSEGQIRAALPQIREWTLRGPSIAANPRVPTASEVEALLWTVFHGRSVTF
ncbi:MAG: iron-containing alcohol dehydrogenase [Thermoplasmata archaeon]